MFTTEHAPSDMAVERALGRHDRLVEAHGCLDTVRQLGMADQVLFVQGLLDEEKGVLVEAG